MKSEKVIVFDVDGTLFDTRQGIIKALNEVLGNFGKDKINSGDENRWIGPPVRESFRFFAGMSESQAEEATKQYRLVYIEKYISESVLYEGIQEVIHELNNIGCHLCIATMKTTDQMERLLSLKELTGTFEVVQTAALNGSKSKSDMLSAIKTSYSPKNEFIMIGDTIGDLEAANKADYKFIGVKYGYGKWGDINDREILFINYANEILNLI